MGNIGREIEHTEIPEPDWTERERRVEPAPERTPEPAPAPAPEKEPEKVPA